ncbi:PIG-L family deacetylase [Pseudorhodobacter sp. MZDSW-24AT]|uniref:PIG-L family deacetylase n=1 Tax=Pseudorhodobacter sp. MZDSW-24AT TaxID=2052957 RepID=UPI000C1F41B3|nr:PIG-L family deacetylase [Pseudorhodobacter sp. MZDSW-24AT]PJF10430.1 PIG-L domain-containing protein [Pseudorhodobacter sp. MZDSW-24AT]
MTDRDRIARQMAEPSLVRLHRALSRLTSVVTVMNTGAHPDDEQSGMLAWLRLGLGMRVVVACSTRGEGGQNTLGPERRGALGILRTREMEEAARALDADVHWLGHGPDDPVHDFGFSKDGDATFARWGEARIVERLVRAYRTERPDVVIPTFLDVPGQHGHHRAMTRAAETALRLAADPAAHPEHAAEGLLPWTVAKYYLPAWSGAGGTYDDEVPPPPATLTLHAPGADPATGAAWDHIGEQSRFYHASQGMGHWRAQPQDTWPLHLKHGAPEAQITDGLPASLAALASYPGAPAALHPAAKAIAEAMAAFPDADAVVAALLRADAALEQAERAEAAFTQAHGHRIRRKRAEVQAACLMAARVMPTLAYATPTRLFPGATATLAWQWALPPQHEVTVTPILPAGVTPSDITATGCTLTVAADAPFTPQFHPGWSAMGGNGPAWLQISATINGRPLTARQDLEAPLEIGPERTLTLDPAAAILPLTAIPATLTLRGAEGADWQLPTGFAIEGETLTLPATLAAGLHELTPMVAGRPAMRRHQAQFAHTGLISHLTPQSLQLLALDLALPAARIAYIGGGGDSVGLWLQRMGADVTVLAKLDPAEDFRRFTTVMVGIVAYGSRADLIAATPALHRFVEGGGHLVTLYQRPDQGWAPDKIPPRRLVVGTPSLRWRVTDATAPVTMLAPDHPLLSGPNRITAADWDGWNKERGIYFASDWDASYTPLLSLHDAGEAPLLGALVSGQIGRGRHTHCALVLHHQLDHLVPGAFRLLANLVQPAG